MTAEPPPPNATIASIYDTRLHWANEKSFIDRLEAFREDKRRHDENERRAMNVNNRKNRTE